MIYQAEQRKRIERSGVVWVIMHWTGYVYVETAARRRRDAIQHFMRMIGGRKKSWAKDFGRYGVYRAEKAKIVIPKYLTSA